MKKEKSKMLYELSLFMLFLGLNSAQAGPKKKITPTPATPHAVEQNVEEAVAPEKCGLLVPCKGTEKVFMYFCSSDKVTIRHCGEKSQWFPQGITHTRADGSSGSCVGDERIMSRDAFMTYIKSQLDSVADSGASLGAVTKDDVALLKSELDIGDLELAIGDHEKKCGNLEGQIKNLRVKLAQITTLSAEGKAAIEADIRKLEGNLGSAKTQITICQNNQASIKKIDDQIKDAVQTLCSKGLHVPAADTFLHGVLSQYDPSKHLCGKRWGLSVAERAKECGEQLKKLSTGQTFSLVARSVDKDGKVSEFVKDDSSGLVWGPEAPETMNSEDAKKYCAGLSDLGLKWSLPTRAEFLKAGNKDNEDKNYGFNKPFSEAMNMKYKDLCSSSLGTAVAWVLYRGKWSFDGYYGRVHVIKPDYPCTVRCVGR